MSYNIFYDCKLIQYKDKFMVDMTTGANNCRELTPTGRWRRERIRYLRNLGTNKIFFTKDEIISYLSNKANEQFESVRSYDEESKKITFEDFSKGYGWYVSLALYGKHTTSTTLKMFQNFFLKGFKKPIQYNRYIFIPPYWKVDETIFINEDNIEELYQKSFSK